MTTTEPFNPCRMCGLNRNVGPEDGGCPDPQDAARYDLVHGDWGDAA